MELSDEDFNELDADTLDEKLADESRDAIWLSQSVDSLKWPQALSVRPVEVRRFK